MNMIKYTKIGQFRNVIKTVKDCCNWNQIPLPTVTFFGEVKLHGTNAAVGLNGFKDYFWCQSRNKVLTPEDDNAGFAKFVQEKENTLHHIIMDYFLEKEGDEVILYGEWCGGSIQKGVALNQLPKMFVIFDVQVNGEIQYNKLNGVLSYFKEGLVEYYNEFGIYFINQFPVEQITIDFSNPEASVNELTKITEQVEQECPVGKALGVSGIGEGVVWKGDFFGDQLMFKVKGQKHSVSKVKTLAPVDPEVLENINSFVEYSVTLNRLEQGLDEVGLSQDKIGAFIGWVNKDIYNEEKDVLESNGLTMKQVAKQLSNEARSWYLEKLNTEY